MARSGAEKNVVLVESTSEWDTVASFGSRPGARPLGALVAATASAAALIVLAMVHPVAMTVAPAVAVSAVVALSWTAILLRAMGPWDALFTARRRWLLALTHVETFEAAALAYVIAANSLHTDSDPIDALVATARSEGIALTEAQCEALRERAMVHARRATIGGSETRDGEQSLTVLTTLRSAQAAARARLVQLEEEYRVRDEGLARGHAFARAEIDADLRFARARLARLESSNAGPDALRYPEAAQVPTSDIGVSVDAMRSAVDRGMADARGGRVAVQPTLLGASLSERARWSVHSNENLAMTRELLALFEPLSGHAPVDELARAEPPGHPPTEPPARK